MYKIVRRLAWKSNLLIIPHFFLCSICKKVVNINTSSNYPMLTRHYKKCSETKIKCLYSFLFFNLSALHLYLLSFRCSANARWIRKEERSNHAPKFIEHLRRFELFWCVKCGTTRNFLKEKLVRFLFSSFYAQNINPLSFFSISDNYVENVRELVWIQQ